MNTRSPLSSRGFSLVEIIIVVVILGILAAIVIPQFTTAAETARQNSVKMDLSRIRQQIEIYKQHHNGKPPTLVNFANQLTLATNTTGNTAAVGTAGFPLGPYLQSIPKNPYTGTSDIGDGGVGNTAWYYDEPGGGIFLANSDAAHLLW